MEPTGKRATVAKLLNGLVAGQLRLGEGLKDDLALLDAESLRADAHTHGLQHGGAENHLFQNKGRY